MKKIIDEQRHKLLEKNRELNAAHVSKEIEVLSPAPINEAAIRAAFDAIDAELGWFLAKLESDARKMEMAARKLPRTATLLETFAAMLRNYADRLRGEKKETARIIVPNEFNGSGN